jgi:acyl CoA:acetate/3-ketoacid CoA transferase beta subunit
MGVFEKPEGQEEFVLTGLFPNSNARGEEETVRQIQAQCGWELRVASPLKRVEAPTARELRLLRIFDPRRLFLGKL